MALFIALSKTNPLKNYTKTALAILLATSVSLITHANTNIPLSTEKKAIFIIGTGRCGSSCTAGLLQIMGLPLGNQLRGGHPLINPKGFFEDIPTVELTKKMLHDINATFTFPRFIQWNTHPRRKIFQHRIRRCLHKNFNMFPLFGIKNPIIGLFLPLYCQAAQELGYTPKIIIIKRNLEETYASWHNNFKNLSQQQIINAVDSYAQAITLYAPHYDSLEINFNDVIHNTRTVVDQLKQFLPELQPYENVQEEIAAFIDKNLKHHNNSLTTTTLDTTANDAIPR